MLTVATTAVASELAGWYWSLAVLELPGHGLGSRTLAGEQREEQPAEHL
jgi:hypothetical protein